MLESIRNYVAEGVTLTTVGFGMGNYRDDLMEQLADKGNGNCFYVDSYAEATQGLRDAARRHARGDRQGREDPGGVRPGGGAALPAGRLREPRHRRPGLPQRQGGRGRDWRGPHRHRALRGGADGRAGDVWPPCASAPRRPTAPRPPSRPSPSSAACCARRWRRPPRTSASRWRWRPRRTSCAQSPAAQGWSLATARKLAEGATEGQAERDEFVKLVTQAQALMRATASHER